LSPVLPDGKRFDVALPFHYPSLQVLGQLDANTEA